MLMEKNNKDGSFNPYGWTKLENRSQGYSCLEGLKSIFALSVAMGGETYAKNANNNEQKVFF